MRSHVIDVARSLRDRFHVAKRCDPPVRGRRTLYARARASEDDVVIDERRCRALNDRGRRALMRTTDESEGRNDNENTERCVMYWCSRDRRMRDNDGLVRAEAFARATRTRLVVAAHLGKDECGTGVGGARRGVFALEGMRELERDLRMRGIHMEVTVGEDIAGGVLATAKRLGASAVVCDFTPLREGRLAREVLGRELEKDGCAMIEVDAHNVVPAWVASDKQEYAARTIRPKITRVLGEFLTEPVGDAIALVTTNELPPSEIDWDKFIAFARKAGAHVPEVKGWITPGERAALAALRGPQPDAFLPNRLALYGERNKPTTPLAVSRLSPYLNFGQLSPRRAAWEASQLRGRDKALDEAIDGYLEELIVRRELSDNFCLYNPRYDSLEGASTWAQESLALHASDVRESVYDYEALERGQTHDELWNAAQHELFHLGRMHGFMRMYWAKKILEWTPSPKVALETAIKLNDTYALDGLDPNGYVGCLWSIAGIHDQGWSERSVFGKVRYMNYAGCKRKFDIQAYVDRIAKEVREAKSATL